MSGGELISEHQLAAVEGQRLDLVRVRIRVRVRLRLRVRLSVRVTVQMLAVVPQVPSHDAHPRRQHPCHRVVWGLGC